MGLELPLKQLIGSLVPMEVVKGRDSPVDWTSALAAWILAPPENLECQEVVFSGTLEFMHLGA